MGLCILYSFSRGVIELYAVFIVHTVACATQLLQSNDLYIIVDRPD